MKLISCINTNFYREDHNLPIASTDQGVEIHYSTFICSLGRGQKTITKTVLNCKLQKTSNHQLFVLFSDKRSASENGNHKTIYFWNLCALQKSGTFYIKTFAVYINIESHYRLEACNFYTFDIIFKSQNFTLAVQKVSSQFQVLKLEMRWGMNLRGQNRHKKCFNAVFIRMWTHVCIHVIDRWLYSSCVRQPQEPPSFGLLRHLWITIV